MGFANNIIPPQLLEAMLENPKYCELCDDQLCLDRLIHGFNICQPCDEELEERCKRPVVTCTLEELFELVEDELELTPQEKIKRGLEDAAAGRVAPKEWKDPGCVKDVRNNSKD